MSNNLSLSIDSWSAWSDGLSVQQDISEKVNTEKVTLSQVAPMKRRRMSRLTKMALQTALECLKGASQTTQNPLYLFASQHGELTRSSKIVKDLISSEDISPTDFSLSVHNSASGLLSINESNTSPVNSIAAGENTFGCALIEASNLLQRFPQQKVLLVCFDETLPSPLEKFEQAEQLSYSVALLLSNSEDNSVEFGLEESATIKSGSYPDALEFIKFLGSSQASNQIRRWKFSKDVKQA